MRDLYRVAVKGDVDTRDMPKEEVDKELEKSREEYFKMQAREQFFSMKETKIPKGVKFSFCVMSTPLLLGTGYLGVLLPLVETASAGSAASPENFAYVARTAVRLLNLNLAFFGGVHYGFGSAFYEGAANEKEETAARRQMFYSFLPGLASTAVTSYILFASPLSHAAVLGSFSWLVAQQVVMLTADKSYVKAGQAPQWYGRFRNATFTFHMLMTGFLAYTYYNYKQFCRRRNDPNRITNLKSAMELEDAEFLKMVDDLDLDFDYEDMKEIEIENAEV